MDQDTNENVYDIVMTVVNRAAVRLRKEFYQAKVATLSESSTREWWRHNYEISYGNHVE